MPRHALTLSLAVASLAAVTGCGEANERERAPAAKPDVDALVAELSGAGPQRRVSGQQAAATAMRQARITRRYAEPAAAGACKQSLVTLQRAYQRYSATTTTVTSPEDLAAAAAVVPTALGEAERACA